MIKASAGSAGSRAGSQKPPDVEKNDYDPPSQERNLSPWSSTTLMPASSPAEDGPSSESVAINGAPQVLMTSSWNSSLLCEWTSTRDRVNRWLLHSLGTNEDYAASHRQMCDALFRPWPHLRDMRPVPWSRLVLKYWFLDDAATGVGAENIMTTLDEAHEMARKANSSLRALGLFVCASTNISTDTQSGPGQDDQEVAKTPDKPATPPVTELEFWQTLDEALYKALKDADRLRNQLSSLDRIQHLEALSSAPVQPLSHIFRVFESKRNLLKERIDITEGRVRQFRDAYSRKYANRFVPQTIRRTYSSPALLKQLASASKRQPQPFKRVGSEPVLVRASARLTGRTSARRRVSGKLRQTTKKSYLVWNVHTNQNDTIGRQHTTGTWRKSV